MTSFAGSAKISRACSDNSLFRDQTGPNVRWGMERATISHFQAYLVLRSGDAERELD